MTKEAKTSVILTPGQARAIVALEFERQEIARGANEQIGQIVAAFQEQGRLLAMVHQLPRGEKIKYRFDTVEMEGEPRLKLTALPPATKEEEGDGQVELPGDPG